MCPAARPAPPRWTPQREVSAAGREQWWMEPSDDHTDRVAAAHGLVVARRVHRMERSLLDGAALTDPVATRAFRPGADDEAWVALNAAAFADHPDQGHWTLADLRARTAEPWFDPEGFRLLDGPDGPSGPLAGACWTRLHPGEGGPTGEIFVIGVHPDHQGRGLGRGLVVAGLQWLRERRGATRAVLYVEASNEGALAVYRALGFRVVATRTGYEAAPDATGVGR